MASRALKILQENNGMPTHLTRASANFLCILESWMQGIVINYFPAIKMAVNSHLFSLNEWHGELSLKQYLTLISGDSLALAACSKKEIYFRVLLKQFRGDVFRVVSSIWNNTKRKYVIVSHPRCHIGWISLNFVPSENVRLVVDLTP